MLKRSDILSLNYYNFAQPFFGSNRGIRFRIAREPLVHYQWGDKELLKIPPVLSVILWKEPFCFEKTPEEEKVIRNFAFSEEGMTEAVEWINGFSENDTNGE